MTTEAGADTAQALWEDYEQKQAAAMVAEKEADQAYQAWMEAEDRDES